MNTNKETLSRLAAILSGPAVDETPADFSFEDETTTRSMLPCYDDTTLPTAARLTIHLRAQDQEQLQRKMARTHLVIEKHKDDLWDRGFLKFDLQKIEEPHQTLTGWTRNLVYRTLYTGA